MTSYDPQSQDAMFARILQRLDSQDAALGRIEHSVHNVRNDVEELKLWQTEVKARIAVVSLLISGVVTSVLIVIDRIWK